MKASNDILKVLRPLEVRIDVWWRKEKHFFLIELSQKTMKVIMMKGQTAWPFFPWENATSTDHLNNCPVSFGATSKLNNLRRDPIRTKNSCVTRYEKTIIIEIHEISFSVYSFQRWRIYRRQDPVKHSVYDTRWNWIWWY